MGKKRKKQSSGKPPEVPQWQRNSFDKASWLRCLEEREFYALQASFQSLILDGCPGISDRKVSLYDIALARHVLHLCDSELLRRTIELAEEEADRTGGMTNRVLPTYEPIHKALAERGPPPECVPLPPLSDLVHATLSLASYLADREPVEHRVRWMGGRAAKVAAVASGDPDSHPIADMDAWLLSDIFGNWHQSSFIRRTLRTKAIVALARGMYESRDFAEMPILADALENAGCADSSVLDHCRIPGQHVRGCWVVDLVLGKE